MMGTYHRHLQKEQVRFYLTFVLGHIGDEVPSNSSSVLLSLRYGTRLGFSKLLLEDQLHVNLLTSAQSFTLKACLSLEFWEFCRPLTHHLQVVEDGRRHHHHHQNQAHAHSAECCRGARAEPRGRGGRPEAGTEAHRCCRAVSQSVSW